MMMMMMMMMMMTHLLVMTLLRSLLTHTALTTDLHRFLLTLGVSHKLAVTLVNVPGGAGGLVHSPALPGPLSVTNLLHRSVALPDCLLHRLLLESYLTTLLEILLTGLLLGWLEVGDVGVVTLLHVLMFTLQDWILRQSLHPLLLDNTQSSVCCSRGLAEVHSARHGNLLSCQLRSRHGGGARTDER